MNETEVIERISLTNQRINGVTGDLKFLTEARITYTNTQLVKYMELLYQKACYNYLRGMFHASPGFFAILVAIWGVITAIYNGIKFIIDLLHVKELLQLLDILAILWPEFRKKMNQIYGKISEFSAQIGWGADGLSHLVQAAQGGLNLIGGFLNKPESWLQIQGADKVVGAMERLSDWSNMISSDPGQLLDLLFRSQSNIVMREHKKWWDDTMAWLDKTANTAEEAIIKVNDTIDNLMELHNNMPQIVRDHIPQGLMDGLTWIDNQIDDTILPALTQISKEFTTINDQLQAQRDRAQELANKLLLPGNLLLGVDTLPPPMRDIEEEKIDDVTNRLYNTEADFAEKEDTEIIKYLDSIMGILTIAVTPPEYTKIETLPSTAIVWDPAEKVERWFVGDF